jgi:hypothetical protein
MKEVVIILCKNSVFRTISMAALMPVMVLGVVLLTTNQVVHSEEVYGSGLFQLGDGQPPPGYPGTAEIWANPEQPEPDWSDLFNADRSLKDDYDAYGNPVSNGVPDYVDLWGGQWGVFPFEVAQGDAAVDLTALTYIDSVPYVVNGEVAPHHDLGNSYVYSTFGLSGNVILYAGAERMAPGDSYIEFEFNQAHIRLGHGPPWEITGGNVDGDLLVRMDFTGGSLVSAGIWQWVETGSGEGAWQGVDSLVGEGCNATGTACVVCNDFDIDGGPWPNYDAYGDPEQVTAGQFLEIGLDVAALTGLDVDFTSIQIRTPEDISFGHFAEGN